MTVRALVVGSFVTDLAFRIPKRPAPGEVVVATDFTTFRGGKGYNQAIGLARLGAEVTMVGAVGGDEYGEHFIASLEEEGVDCGRVVQMRGASTGLAVPLITPGGETAFVQHPGANHLLSAAHCADLPDSDILLLQGEVTPHASEHAGKVIGKRDGRVLLNAAPIDEVTPTLLEQASVVVCNEVQARGLLARSGGEADRVDREDLAARLPVDRCDVVVALGARGAVYRTADGGRGAVPGFEVDAVDATGSGDAFSAALGCRLAEGADLGSAALFATAAAALATTVHGAEPSLPRREAVDELLAQA